MTSEQHRCACSEIAPPGILRDGKDVISTSRSGVSHAHANVLGVRISAVNMADAVALAEQWIAARRPGYICMTGVHGVMEAHGDQELLRVLNSAALNAPDGMPMSWVGRFQGYSEMDRVFGPDFMMEICRRSVSTGYRHYLCGGRPGVADALRNALQMKFPGICVVGTYTPPFRDLTASEEQELIAGVRAAKPDIVWVGLSTPKQERFMAAWLGRLETPLMVGVGAAFDYHTGNIRDAPQWVKRAGLQWLHRLAQDPARLWRRYLRNNPAFLWHIALQLTGLRKYE